MYTRRATAVFGCIENGSAFVQNYNISDIMTDAPRGVADVGAGKRHVFIGSHVVYFLRKPAYYIVCNTIEKEKKVWFSAGATAVAIFTIFLQRVYFGSFFLLYYKST